MSDGYKSVHSAEAYVTMVEVDQERHFLVVRFNPPEWRTLVLQRDDKLDYWSGRRECEGSIDPASAVTGALLRDELQNPVALLRRHLQIERRSNSILRDEINRLKEMVASMKSSGKRGRKRGRRNS